MRGSIDYTLTLKPGIEIDLEIFFDYEETQFGTTFEVEQVNVDSATIHGRDFARRDLFNRGWNDTLAILCGRRLDVILEYPCNPIEDEILNYIWQTGPYRGGIDPWYD